MEINKIENLTDLYNYVKDSKLESAPPIRKEILRYEISRIKRKKYEGRYAFLKKIIIKFYPVRYMLAARNYKTIISFRSASLKQKLSKSAKEDILNNIDKYKEAWELLDKDSKKVYLNMLIYRLTGDYKFAMEIQSSNCQYFSNKLVWKNNEVIVDCGAYVGDTLLAFLNSPINVKSYYLYELDDENYVKMLEVCKNAEKRDIKVYPRKKGVYNCSTTLYFQADADSSMLVDYPTDTTIQVVSIDEDIKDRVSFIKMDIEGSELEAIEGAKEIIRRDKPALAICIYHKQEDFWKIPLRIKEICPEYKRFWIEHYSPWDIETVLFVGV